MFYRIRAMQQNDLEEVYAIEKASHREPWTREIIRDCLLVGYDCRILELTFPLLKQIAGYIISRYSVSNCHILNLCIKKNKRRKGYGEKLLNSVLDALLFSEINTIFLEVRLSNTAAISLYEKLGFQKELIKKDYYIDTQGTEDAIVFKKDI